MPIHKYFIALLPGPALSDKITAFRRKYLPGINSSDEHKKFPHLTLQHTFSRMESIEPELGVYLTDLSGSLQAFPVELSGIAHFGDRVIYIKVKENERLTALHLAIKEILINKFLFSLHEVAADFKPHMTLEKKLAGAQFKTCWQNIRDVEVNESFTAESISLLRHNGVKWEVIENFRMRQGS